MSSPHPLRILIADDHPIFRTGLKALLSSSPGWMVCAEATTGREAVALVAKHRPDIVVMDMAMPELNGLEATRTIRKDFPIIQVVILSHYHSDQLMREIVHAGARAFVLKSDAAPDLLTAIEAVANCQTFFTSYADKILVEGFIEKSAANRSSSMGDLSAREREIVQLLAEGKGTKELAWVLGISSKTADAHRGHIYRKLKIHSASELVRYAVRNNIIEP